MRQCYESDFAFMNLREKHKLLKGWDEMRDEWIVLSVYDTFVLPFVAVALIVVFVAISAAWATATDTDFSTNC